MNALLTFLITFCQRKHVMHIPENVGKEVAPIKRSLGTVYFLLSARGQVPFQTSEPSCDAVPLRRAHSELQSSRSAQQVGFTQMASCI